MTDDSSSLLVQPAGQACWSSLDTGHQVKRDGQALHRRAVKPADTNEQSCRMQSSRSPCSLLAGRRQSRTGPVCRILSFITLKVSVSFRANMKKGDKVPECRNTVCFCDLVDFAFFSKSGRRGPKWSVCEGNVKGNWQAWKSGFLGGGSPDASVVAVDSNGRWAGRT